MVEYDKTISKEKCLPTPAHAWTPSNPILSPPGKSPKMSRMYRSFLALPIISGCQYLSNQEPKITTKLSLVNCFKPLAFFDFKCLWSTRIDFVSRSLKKLINSKRKEHMVFRLLTKYLCIVEEN
jgi:hypothetical protein